MKTYCTQFTAQRSIRFLAVLLAASASLHAAIRITAVSGTASLHTAGGEYRDAVVGDVLQPGDSVVTSYHSEVEFQSDGATVTIEENTSVSESDGNTPQSVELNYGVINGQVPHSSSGMFSVYTPLGVPEVQAGRFMVNSIFNVERQEMILQVENMDGRVGLRSRYAGTMEYGRYYAGDKNYNGAMTEDIAEIPPQHMAIIRLPVRDPYFFDRVDASRHMAPESAAEMAQVDFDRESIIRRRDPVITTVVDPTVRIDPRAPILTPEDNVQVPSPSGRQ